MNKLMILGAAYTQIPLYEAARRLGLTTVAVSIPGEYAGFDYADEKVYADISNPAACIKAAQDTWADGVATCGLDLGMKSIGAVCDAFSLAGPSGKAAETVSDKYLMKTALEKAGVRTARFVLVRSEDDLIRSMKKLKFPLVVKAVDLMGGRGIFVCRTPEEVTLNYRKTMSVTGKNYCIVEEFVKGELFGVEAMVQKGEILFILPNNTESFEAAAKIPVGHSIPFAKGNAAREKAIFEVKRAIRAVGLDNCPVNCDCILSGDDVYIVEITGRCGATGLAEMVGLHFGIDYYEAIAKLAMGMDVSGMFADPDSDCILTRTLTSPVSGVLTRVRNFNPPDERIVDLSFNVGAGDAVRPFTNGRDRTGQIIIKAKSCDEAEAVYKRVTSLITYELRGDLPLTVTPIKKLANDLVNNHIYMKHEEMLPFSFGGNKVRFADAYFRDMEAKGCNAMIIYGGYTSNLCRIMSEACGKRKIPCSMVYNIDDSDPAADTFNARLIKIRGIKEYRCHKNEISTSVKQAMEDFKAEGYVPYYIHGDCFGYGNVTTPMDTYVKVYYEILDQEKKLGVVFDYIFLSTSTNTSQSGLLAGHLIMGDAKKIVGISAGRSAERAEEVIRANLDEYAGKTGAEYILPVLPEITVDDGYVGGGYGKVSDSVRQVITYIYRSEDIPLDPIYTGKAFYGMCEYLKKNGIRNKNVLFIHTGGTPLFYDAFPELTDKGNKEQES